MSSSRRVFHSLGTCLWRLTFKWAKWRHRKKPRSWIIGRYFGTFNPFKNYRRVFGDRDGGLPGQVLLDRHPTARAGR